MSRIDITKKTWQINCHKISLCVYVCLLNIDWQIWIFIKNRKHWFATKVYFILLCRGEKQKFCIKRVWNWFEQNKTRPVDVASKKIVSISPRHLSGFRESTIITYLDKNKKKTLKAIACVRSSCYTHGRLISLLNEFRFNLFSAFNRWGTAPTVLLLLYRSFPLILKHNCLSYETIDQHTMSPNSLVNVIVI